jgi:hypothetical protein
MYCIHGGEGGEDRSLGQGPGFARACVTCVARTCVACTRACVSCACVTGARSGLLAKQERHVTALALTAYASSEDAQRARAAGFQMHVPKPVAADKLVQAIAQLVAKAPRP